MHIHGCLTEVATPAILNVRDNSVSISPVHPFVEDSMTGAGEDQPTQRESDRIVLGFLALFKAGAKRRHYHEYFFTYLLTEKGSCDMIVRAWIIPCCGDADAAAEAPPRLTFSLSLAYPSAQASDYYLQREGRRRFRGKRISPLSQM